MVSRQPFPENVSISDCLVCNQSLLTVPKWGILHTCVSFGVTIAGHSPFSKAMNEASFASRRSYLCFPPVCYCCRKGCKSRTCGLLRVPEPPTRVRFLIALPTSLKSRGIRRPYPGNRAKWPQFRIVLLSNRTGVSVPSNCYGPAWRPFLQRASEQSGFKDSVWRMQCDHKSMMWRNRLDFCLPSGVHHYGCCEASHPSQN
jgi:hypothetical protein